MPPTARSAQIGEGFAGFGSAEFGNFTVLNADRSGRFLDSPEFYPMHDIGNNETFFDRLDFQPNGKDSLHLDLFAARNWFQIPNTYDQPGRTRQQKVDSFNIAPGYQHTYRGQYAADRESLGAARLLELLPQPQPFPGSAGDASSQDRHLLNYGVRADLSSVIGRHNIKIGTELKQTRLLEDFALGITDFTFNPVCFDGAGETPQDRRA